jgi:hypothetical protein
VLAQKVSGVVGGVEESNHKVSGQDFHYSEPRNEAHSDS